MLTQSPYDAQGPLKCLACGGSGFMLHILPVGSSDVLAIVCMTEACPGHTQVPLSLVASLCD